MRFLKSVWFYVASALSLASLVAGWLLRDKVRQAQALAKITARQAKHSQETSDAFELKRAATKSEAKAQAHLASAARHADSAAQARRDAQDALRELDSAHDRDAFVETFNRLSGAGVPDLDPVDPHGSGPPSA